MNVQISFALLLAASVISFQDDDDASKRARKHYGLSYHSKCIDYVKSFTCMTSCKSIGFQVFRMDFRCKCSCHELKTTTILPFFKWRTNGTTKTLPSTQSPQLYHIAGTLSPARSYNDTDYTEIMETTTNATTITCAYGPPTDNSTDSNSTVPDDMAGNATTVDDEASGNATDVLESTVATTVSVDDATESGNATDGSDATTPPGDEATTAAEGEPE